MSIKKQKTKNKKKIFNRATHEIRLSFAIETKLLLISLVFRCNNDDMSHLSH